MALTERTGRWAWLRAPMFSPRGFVVRALLLALAHGVLTLLGLRRCMSMLALTVPDGMSSSVAGAGCVLYLLSYLGFVLVVPTVLLAAALWALTEWLRGRPRP